MSNNQLSGNQLTSQPMPIYQVGVVGAGTMGSAIAQHFIMKGMKVTLIDQTDEYLTKGIGHIKQSLGEAKQRHIISDEQYDGFLSNLSTSTNKQVLKDCALIVEAVFEDLQIKKELFRELEDIVSDDCILASNTSSFLVADIAEGLKSPGRVVGVHYFYHAAKNKLVEVIPSSNTSTEITNKLMDFYAYVDKTPIKVADAAGFAVNRFFVPWLNEAVRLLEEGHGSIHSIDELCCQVFGVAMGPFALMNATGVPIAQHAAQGLANKLGEFYAPAKQLITQVESKQDWDLASQQILNSGRYNPKLITQRMIGATLGVAAQMVSEGVVDAAEADLGARSGLRWPRGPFELINQIGVEKVKSDVTQLFNHWDMPVPSFPFSEPGPVQLKWVSFHTNQNAGFIRFNLPDRMNPLGEATMAQLDHCIDQLNANDSIDKIFICGQGKAFVAGADIKFFLDAIEAKNLDRIQQFTEFGQAVFNKISRSHKTTYAYLDGLALGGGFELALACDYRIATRKTVIGFPETGIGIYPGLGGTQRTSRLIGAGATKYLIATGQFLNAEKAYQLGLVDKVIEPVFNADELIDFDLDSAQSGMQQTALNEIDFNLFNGELTEELKQQFNNSPVFAKSEKVLARKAPVALKMAMDLIEQGASLTLEEGLQLELNGLKTIFASKDAKTGLTSILSGEKPNYVGA